MDSFEVWSVCLDPTQGAEIQKTRPCVIVSPNEIKQLKTVVVVPMTTKGYPYPFRIKTTFNEKNGLLLIDQIRAVDKSRLIKKLGLIDLKTQYQLRDTLIEFFS